MDYSESNEIICRICLDENVTLDWNDKINETHGISYRDCYYKYTPIMENASDPFPTKLCDQCSCGLKNAHLLFEKALRTIRILDDTFKAKELKNHSIFIKEEPNDLTIEPIDDNDCIPSDSDDKVQIDLELERVTEIKIDIPDELSSISDDDKFELPRHFFEITNYESSRDDFLENTMESIKLKSSARATSRGSGERKKRFNCKYCSLKFSARCVLRKHESTHNQNRERTETCPHCGVKLYNKQSLRVHLKIHDEKREKKFKCEYCDKAFYNRGACNIHRRIHLGQMVPCPICPKEFYRKVDLGRHLATNHSIGSDRKEFKRSAYTVQCKYCNKTIRSTSWREHEAEHLNQPQMKCKICNEDFYARAKCVKHLKSIHQKTKEEYDGNIEYYINNDCKKVSHLKLTQQNIVKSLAK